MAQSNGFPNGGSPRGYPGGRRRDPVDYVIILEKVGDYDARATGKSWREPIGVDQQSLLSLPLPFGGSFGALKTSMCFLERVCADRAEGVKTELEMRH